jgi:hypothetical protein
MITETKNSNKVVFGLFDTRFALESAVETLKQRSFRNSDISALLPSKEGTKDFAHENSTKAPEGATTGALSGATVGGVLGWLVGIGSLAIPGIGPFVAAGPILAALSGASIGGAVGGITGALIGFGIPEYEAKRYESEMKKGGMLLSVHANSSEQVEEAKKIFKDAGARDISSSTEEKSPSAHERMKTNIDNTPNASRT